MSDFTLKKQATYVKHLQKRFVLHVGLQNAAARLQKTDHITDGLKDLLR